MAAVARACVLISMSADCARGRIVDSRRARGALLTCLAVGLAAGLVGCGGGGTDHKSVAAAGAPSHKYVARLSGRGEPGGGAPAGRGFAIVALHDAAREVCWRFAHLHGFFEATSAAVHHRAGRSRSGPVEIALSAGPRLHHQGCTSASTRLLAALAGDPGAYYVNVESARYRHGAVRGAL